MADQYDPKYAVPEGSPTGNEAVRIKAIYIHPIKSCGPIELERAVLTKSGFMYDRCFALAAGTVVKTAGKAGLEWKFLSQRTKPCMSQIKTELWLPHEGSDPNDPLVQAGGCVVLTFQDPDADTTAPGTISRFKTWSISPTKPEASIIIPLQPTPSQLAEYKLQPEPFTIHARTAHGLDMGKLPSVAAALPKLKKFLAMPENQRLTLFRCTPDTLVRTDKNLAPLEYIGSPAVHGYTDQQPVNINSLSSVHAVSTLLPPAHQPLNALRFRANLWITGTPAYEEETWKRYRILPKSNSTNKRNAARANVAPKLSVVCRTSRCTIPNVNLEMGTFDADPPAPGRKKGKPQPSATLVEYRTVEDGNKKALGYLGMHCVPEDRSLREAEEEGVELYVEVGDEIEVLERGEHLYGSTGNDY